MASSRAKLPLFFIIIQYFILFIIIQYFILAGYFIVLFIIFIWNNVYNMFHLLLMCLLHYIKT
jgi:hypothetical protein